MACRCCHFFKAHALPQVLGKPIGDCRCKKSQNCNLYSVLAYHLVRAQIGLAVVGSYYVCTKYRAFYLVYPLVIYRMSGLHIMISYGLCIVAKIVYDLCRNVCNVILHIVEVVARGLSLQYVAVIQHDEVVSVFFSHHAGVCTKSCQRAFCLLALYEVVRKEASVYVTCAQHP